MLDRSRSPGRSILDHPPLKQCSGSTQASSVTPQSDDFAAHPDLDEYVAHCRSDGSEFADGGLNESMEDRAFCLVPSCGSFVKNGGFASSQSQNCLEVSGDRQTSSVCHLPKWCPYTPRIKRNAFIPFRMWRIGWCHSRKNIMVPSWQIYVGGLSQSHL